MPASPRTGRGLAVLGNVFGAPPDVAAGAGGAAGAAAGAGAAAAPAGAAGGVFVASVAFTSLSVSTLGGFVVMMVAVIRSFSRKSEI